MKVCKRAVDWLQIVNAEGDVRVCGWMSGNLIGNIVENDFKTLINGAKAKEIFASFEDGSFSKCDMDNCPYLANGSIDEILVDVDELPEYPEILYLGYEGNCNYNCTCCTSYQHMKDTKENDYTQKYDVLEEKIRKIMPFVKIISANGRGELFASPRTIKLLSEWKPLAPQEEIRVELESNGSLFNEKNWEKIKNLGKYYLSVAITVMSFDEMVYQHLSGTKLPISNIENNLRFVKKLREEGIINYLEIATVLQEENFREMPEFTRRCLDEFGADNVRIRPIIPAGPFDENIRWFTNVRNPYHPCYEQYVKVMSHPIFQNSKVLLWSGNIASNAGEAPYVKQKRIMDINSRLLSNNELFDFVMDNIKNDEGKIYLYGLSMLTKTIILINSLERRENIDAVMDQSVRFNEYRNVNICSPDSYSLDKNATVLVTVYGQYDTIKTKLVEFGFRGKIINLYDLVQKFENLR